MSLLLPGVLGSASCLKDLACVLPRSFSLVILYFIFYSGQMEVLFSVSVVARGNQGGLYVFFFLRGMICCISGSWLWAEFLLQEYFSLAFMCFLFNLVNPLKQTKNHTWWLCVRNWFIVFTVIDFLQSFFCESCFIWYKIICIWKAEVHLGTLAVSLLTAELHSLQCTQFPNQKDRKDSLKYHVVKLNPSLNPHFHSVWWSDLRLGFLYPCVFCCWKQVGRNRHVLCLLLMLINI